MWNRPVTMLWLSVDVQTGKRIRFSIPLSMCALLIVIDILDDAAILAPLFSPLLKQRYSNAPYDSIKTLSAALRTLTAELLLRTGPTTLADIEWQDKEDHVRLVCKLI